MLFVLNVIFSQRSERIISIIGFLISLYNFAKKTMKKSAYIFLGILLLLNVILVPLFMPSGGLSSDTLSYFQLANELPNPSWSLWPLAYPVFLRLLNFFFNDYFWTSKFLNILIFLLIVSFSYLKKFYFKETMILLSTKIFVYLFYYSLSEPLFLTCLYFLVYYLEGYFTGRLKSRRFFIPAAILLSLCFMVRYSGLYIAVAFGVFYLVFYFANRKEKSFFRDDFFYFLLCSAIGIGGYMLYNFYRFEDLAERDLEMIPTIH